MFCPLVSLWYFGGSFVGFLFNVEWLMLPQFQRVHLSPQWPIIDQLAQHLYCPRFLRVWCRLVLGVLWNAEVCFQPPSSLRGKVLLFVMSFCEWHTHYRTLWRLARRLEWCRSTSVLLLTGSTIRGFSSSSALCELVHNEKKLWYK